MSLVFMGWHLIPISGGGGGVGRVWVLLEHRTLHLVWCFSEMKHKLSVQIIHLLGLWHTRWYVRLTQTKSSLRSFLYPVTSIKFCLLKLLYTHRYVRHFLHIDKLCIFNSPDASFSKPLHFIFFIIGVIPFEEEAVAITLERQICVAMWSRK